MKTLRFDVRVILERVTPIVLLILIAACSRPIRNDEVVARARNRYFNLHAHGIKAFSVSAHSNWSRFLEGDIEALPEQKERMIALLDSMRFTAYVDSNGNCHVSHKPEIPTFLGVIDYKKKVFLMERLLAGLFTEWADFSVKSLFPTGCDFMVEGTGPYNITHHMLGYSVATSMTKDLLITERAVHGKEMSGLETPTFITNDGVLFVKRVLVAGRIKDGDELRLDGDISYGSVEGIQLPVGGYCSMPTLGIGCGWVFDDHQLVRD